MNTCRLCSELESRPPAKAWNAPLLESPNFVGIPSLGPLLQGWLLLVPKRHFISFGAVPSSMIAEMNEFKALMCSVLSKCYGPISIFEHGPSAASRNVGCGVDHAHLHLVPIQFDLLAEVSPFLPSDVMWASAGIEDCRHAYDQGKDYLYLEQPIGLGRMATHDKFGSQLFRRAIATRIGIQDQFNWREHEHLPTVMATIQTIRALGSPGAADTNSDLAA